ncbi:MAG: response regulator [Candidatus Dormiibacterota bacterium]
MAGSATPDDSIRVLLVEDDAEFAEMYRIRLEADDYAVEWARDGHEGLDLARTWKPSLIFLDIRMPEMNGLELLRALRADAGTAGVPVVVLTNYSDESLQQEGIEFGILDWKLKMDTTPSGISAWIDRWSRALAEEDAPS